MSRAPANEKGAQRSVHEAAAKQIWHACPVLRRCRSHAIETNEQHGIWGATTPGERSALRGRDVRGA
ncbi:WhiB family transcriptional regulator [Mycolicibacterium helvum]|uniref:WhiB family transcriptional regulator n=1 Tax=Mycolicibacterium helvum TaxID=1534349 RepID=UPI0013CF54FB|nr:WhiB family transcriptional regulator [Mycolicibacterium helvum]